MGLILGEWGSLLGARMIGTVSSPEKAEVARAHGYETVINYSSEDFSVRTMDETNGTGADVDLTGLAFATNNGRMSPSLRNILKELHDSYGCDVPADFDTL